MSWVGVFLLFFFIFMFKFSILTLHYIWLMTVICWVFYIFFKKKKIELKKVFHIFSIYKMCSNKTHLFTNFGEYTKGHHFTIIGCQILYFCDIVEIMALQYKKNFQLRFSYCNCNYIF